MKRIGYLILQATMQLTFAPRWLLSCGGPWRLPSDFLVLAIFTDAMNAPMIPQRSPRPRAVSFTAAWSDSAARQLVRSWWLMVAMAMALWTFGQAFGQDAASTAGNQGTAAVGKPLPEQYKRRDVVTTMERARSEGLTKADFSDQWASHSAFQAYYLNYLFGKLMDPAYVTEYGTILQTFQDDMERAQRSRSPSFAAISSWVLRGAPAVAAGDFHPSARVNATLLLAYLDEKGADARAGTAPVPAGQALLRLVQIYRDDSAPDAVKAAALQGLARHAQLGAVTDARVRAGLATMMKQLASSEPPAGRDPAVHAFLQRYAVDVLNLLANPTATPDTAQTLVSLSTTAENPDLIAAYAAAKLGQFKAGQTLQADPKTVLNSWAVRLSAVVDDELDRIAKLAPPPAVRDQPPPPVDPNRRMAAGGMPGGYDGGMPGGYDGGMMEGYPGGGYEGSSDMMPGGYDMMEYDPMGMGSMGMGMAPRAKPQPPEVVASRRRINHVFQQLQYGATGQPTTGRPATAGGLLVAETDANRADFNNWIKAVDTVSKAINQNTLDNRKKYVDELQLQSEVLRKLAGLPPKGAVTTPGNRSRQTAPAGQAALPAGGSAADPLVSAGPDFAGPGAVVPASGVASSGGVATAGGLSPADNLAPADGLSPAGELPNDFPAAATAPSGDQPAVTADDDLLSQP